MLIRPKEASELACPPDSKPRAPLPGRQRAKRRGGRPASLCKALSWTGFSLGGSPCVARYLSPIGSQNAR